MITRKPNHNQNSRIDQFIEFFKTIGTGKAVAEPLDMKHSPAWNQTEEEYQAEQARWLAERKIRNTGKK